MSLPMPNRTSASFSADQHSNLWMLSFGDLLTLILCIFLVLISTGVFQVGKQNQDNPAGYIGSLPMPNISQAAAKDGRAFASPSSYSRGKVFFLTPEDLKTNEVESLSQKVIQLREMDREGVNMVIQWCGSVLGARESETEAQGLMRTRSALGFHHATVSFRGEGKGCTGRSEEPNSNIRIEIEDHV